MKGRVMCYDALLSYDIALEMTILSVTLSLYVCLSRSGYYLSH